MTIINRNSELGGMEYPFLTQFDDWFIQSSPLDAAGDPSKSTITLRWVKDNKVNDLYIPNMNASDFLEATGLRLNNQRKGPFVLSKRISRMMRPYRFWEFANPNIIRITHSTEISNKEWDGCALISRQYLIGLHMRYRTNHPHLPEHELKAHLSELRRCKRWEITILHEGGQEKAHAIVVDDLVADFLLPEGSTKEEISLHGKVFIGLQPVHGRSDMRLDIQSLINLYPFFESAKLVAWLAQEADLFLNRIQSGQLDVLLSRIENIQSEEQLFELRNWYIGEYIASGGKLMWFPAAVKAMGRQFARRLNHGQDNFRFPIPGGRYYIFPSSVGDRDVPTGHIEIEHATGTAWVNQDDWNNYIVDILGGCDGDDALWIFPFTDFDNSKKILAWRSPNQLGEYVLLSPTDESDAIVWEITAGSVTWPRMDSRKLPARIDEIDYQYGQLEPFDQNHAEHYSIEAMQPAIENALQNGGMLGAYCNALMILKSVHGHLPFDLPARLEDVIDGSVKAPVDLSPVRVWIQEQMTEIVADTYDAVPAELAGRILPALDKDNRNALQIDTGHWLTSLMAMTNHQVEIFQENLRVLAELTVTPLIIYRKGLPLEERGTPLVAEYQRIVKRSGPREAGAKILEMLDNQHSAALLGAAAYIYNRGLSDSLLWLPDPKLADGEYGPAQPGTAKLFIHALREIGLIGDPVWTSRGAVIFYDEEPTGVSVQINGAWFNSLKARNLDWNHCTAMSQVPAAVRQTAKAYINTNGGSFAGTHMHTRVTNSGRVTMHTQEGDLIGYVKEGQEIRTLASETWFAEFAESTDGNLHTVLMAV